MSKGTLEITTQGDTDILFKRVFNAPRAMVFDALTKPELLKRWFGPRVWNLAECQIDLRPGGKWRFVLRRADGREMGMYGEYIEIAPPGHMVHTEQFDAYPGSSTITTRLVEENGTTTLTAIVRYDSKETRDGVLKSGMQGGAIETYDRLEELLESVARPA